MEKIELSIPIYLNQRIVFDMLAVIEDGFSQISTVRTSSEGVQTGEGEISADVGTSNAFALLGVKLGLGAKLKTGEEQTDSTISSTERVHTPTSLFQKLRKRLLEDDQVKLLDGFADFTRLSEGDFVEIDGELLKNPIVSLIDGLAAFMELAKSFESGGASSGAKPKKGDDSILKQMKSLSTSLSSGGTIDFISKSEFSENLITSVIPVNSEYFVKGGTNELTDGKYKVFGKIVKVVQEDACQDSINLLRNTSFSTLKTTMIDQMFSSFSGPEVAESGMNIPDLSSSISGPALMIIPIAIFI